MLGQRLYNMLGQRLYNMLGQHFLDEQSEDGFASRNQRWPNENCSLKPNVGPTSTCYLGEGRDGGEEGEGGEGAGGGRRGGGRREKRGWEEGEGRKKGREGKKGNFCARAARAAPEGRRETRGREGEVRGREGERPTPCPPPHVYTEKPKVKMNTCRLRSLGDFNSACYRKMTITPCTFELDLKHWSTCSCILCFAERSITMRSAAGS